MRLAERAAHCVAGLLLAAALSPVARGEEPAIAVIMAAGAAPGKLGRTDLALIYKLKKRYWDDGTRIEPLNLPASQPLRRAFTQQVFNRTPEDLDEYWRDQYFHGVLPPYVLGSEEAMIRLVASTPGAIGYVSVCYIDHRVSVVLRLEGSINCAH